MITQNMTVEEVKEELKKFNDKHCLPIAKLTLTVDEQIKFWTELEELISGPDHSECHRLMLNSIRILSRNKEVVNAVLTKDSMDLLLKMAGFPVEGEVSIRANVDHRDWDTILEASKCISNIYFQSNKAISMYSENQVISRVLRQTTNYDKYKVPLGVIEFDLKIFFLVTARSAEARNQAKYDCKGIETLTRLIRRVVDWSRDKNGGGTAENPQTKLDSEDAAVISAALKALFNLTSGLNTSVPSEDENLDVDQEAFSQYEELAHVSRLVLTVDTEDEEVKSLVVRNTINLLTTFPIKSMVGLTLPLDRNYISDADTKEVKHGDVPVNAPKVILEYFFEVLEQTSPSQRNNELSFRDHITPILKTSCMISAGFPAVRKYFRSRVLPPLTDVSKRPDDQDTPKGRLCRLLTCPDSTISVMVAEFIFILCKENVKRMVKHTGYGNAAGLLARKGLMGGGSSKAAGNYSSTDSDSDTNEYTSNAHRVNPITGYAEPPRAKPFEGMSDEQKEYEAVKLANLIDKLQNMGVVRPAKMGEDGKPHPVEHVLELCENQAQQQLGNIRDHNSDSD